MGDPLVTVEDLNVFLGDDSLNEPRAQMILDDAQQACEDALGGGPVPASKAYVVRRVAVRAYVSGGGQARRFQLSQAGSPMDAPNEAGGVYLTEMDRQDLLNQEEAAPSFEAFTVRLAPQSLAPRLWDAAPYRYEGTAVRWP